MTPTISRRNLIITGLIAVVCAGGYAIAMTLPRTAGTLTPATASPTPSVAATPSTDRPVFSGIDSLVDRGVSSAQIDNLKYALFTYSQSANLHASTIAVDTNSIRKAPFNNQTGATTITFVVSFDSAPLDATISFTNLTSIDTKLANPQTSAVIYDSGPLSGHKL